MRFKAIRKRYNAFWYSYHGRKVKRTLETGHADITYVMHVSKCVSHRERLLKLGGLKNDIRQ